jgi:hypothetical protein
MIDLWDTANLWWANPFLEPTWTPPRGWSGTARWWDRNWQPILLCDIPAPTKCNELRTHYTPDDAIPDELLRSHLTPQFRSIV